MRSALVRWLLGLAMLIGGGGGAWAAISAEEVERWVNQLNDDAFAVREQAVARLLAAGQASVAPLEVAVQGEHLEVTVRGLHVLAELAIGSEDRQARDAAYAAINRLVDSSSNVAAGRAEILLQVIHEARQRKATDLLTARGAKISLEMQTATIGPNWSGNDDDLALLADLYRVQELKLQGPQVNDRWLAHAAALPNLRVLSLKRAGISAQGWPTLAKMPNLTIAHILYMPLDAVAVRALEDLKQIALLRLYGTGIDDKQSEQLSAQLAATKLDIRSGGAFLGVGVQSGNEEILISTVQTGSAAERAGIQVGDIVTRLAGEKISTFEELQTVLGRLPPGQVIPVELLRGDRTETVKIELGEWD